MKNKENYYTLRDNLAIGIAKMADKFDEYKDRGYLDPGSGKCYYYINYDYEQNGRGDIMVEKYYWRGMKWD